MARIFIKSLEDDVFEMYPHLLLVSDFNDLVDEVGREKAGNIIKAIYYIHDPKSDLKDSGMSKTEVVHDISKNLLGDENFDWDENEYLVETYKKVSLNKAEFLAARHDEELDGFNKILKEWTWSKKDAADKSTMMLKFNTLSEKFLEFMEKVKIGKEDMSQSYGSYSKSLIENIGGK